MTKQKQSKIQYIEAAKCIEAIKTLWMKNFLAAGDGNFSFKVDNEIFITPSGRRKCEIKENEFVSVGDKEKASSESLMHLKVFNKCEKAKVVFHAHPPAAIAWSITHDEPFLPNNHLSELILSVGSIPVVPYARPGSEDMGDHLDEFLPKSRVLILKHHGALTWGETVEEALSGMERLEHTCEILIKALHTGKRLSTLPESEVGWLIEKRRSLGEKTL